AAAGRFLVRVAGAGAALRCAYRHRPESRALERERLGSRRGLRCGSRAQTGRRRNLSPALVRGRTARVMARARPGAPRDERDVIPCAHALEPGARWARIDRSTPPRPGAHERSWPRRHRRLRMFRIRTYNQISVKGLERFPRDCYEVASEIGTPDAVLLR